MAIFGIGFRIVLVALAVLFERIGSFLRESRLVQRFIASPPEDLEERLSREA